MIRRDFQGDVVDIAGTMSGGGGPVRKGRMGTRVVVDSSRDATREMKTAEEKLQRDQRRHDEIRQAISQVL